MSDSLLPVREFRRSLCVFFKAFSVLLCKILWYSRVDLNVHNIQTILEYISFHCADYAFVKENEIGLFVFLCTLQALCLFQGVLLMIALEDL